MKLAVALGKILFLLVARQDAVFLEVSGENGEYLRMILRRTRSMILEPNQIVVPPVGIEPTLTA